jgi:S-DNA-T family DNA segregation ATPase FtsK/SpoIIIE
MANKLKTKTPPPLDTEILNEDKEVDVSVAEVVKDERTKKILGAICLLTTVFVFVAIVSYLFSWQEDQDIVHHAGIKIFGNDAPKVHNMLGVLGAYIAHTLVYNGFGIASILLATFFFVLGVNLLFEKNIFSLTKNLKYLSVSLVVISTTLAFCSTNSQLSWGGAVGDFISNWLSGVFGRFGTGAIILLAYFIYFIWKFNPTFKLPERKTLTGDLKIASDVVDDENNIEKTFVDEGRFFIQEDKEDVKLGGIDVDENGMPISGNKLKADSKLVSVTLPEDEEIPFEINERVEEVSNNEDIMVDKVEEEWKPATGKSINDLYAERNIMGEFEEVIATPKTKPTIMDLADLPLEIKEVIEDESPVVEDFESEIAETELEKLSVGSIGTNYEPTLDLANYKYPSTDLLETHGSEKIIHDATELEANKNQIIATLKNYDIEIQRIAATVGPTVTLYEIVPAPGVRISRIKNLEDDIALSLAALGIRIIAPIPGKGTIGIEVPNIKKTIVSMKSLITSEKFQNSSFSLPIAIGKKIDNENFIVDLATMPHLLMAGATGQGKSVGINTLLVSLLYKKHPSQLKLVLVDPKKVELSLYKAIENHFLAKLPGEDDSIITDTKKVVHTLNALCIEMDNRYDLLKEAGCRNIKEYNEKFIARKLNPQKGHQFLPFIVLVVDEFADLIMTAGKEVEMPIARLAQLARAVGIHLIIATQRPSVNIITGTIKANFPARIAFKVSSKIDSRTILDAGGAEQLIGKGDMLISYNGEITRVQCAFVDTPEVEEVCRFIESQQGYPEAFLLPEYVDEKELEKGGGLDANEKDPLFEDAARLIVQNQIGSTSLIQRRMKLGYNRAGRLMDQLERAGVVGPNLGSKAREVRFKTEMELEEFLGMM